MPERKQKDRLGVGAVDVHLQVAILLTAPVPVRPCTCDGPVKLEVLLCLLMQLARSAVALRYQSGTVGTGPSSDCTCQQEGNRPSC